MGKKPEFSRRKFIKTSMMAGAGFALAPRLTARVPATAGSEAESNEDIRWIADYLTGDMRKDTTLANAQPETVTDLPQLKTGRGIETIVVLPDTQFMTLANRPEGASTRRNFLDQVEWIAENRERYNIRYVVHVGDIVQGRSHDVWRFARRAMGVLDGKVPYAIVGGNHDYGSERAGDTRETLMNDYFPVENFKASPHFGGLFEENSIENSYHLLTLGKQKVMILNLEWSTRDAVVEWANEVVAAHPDHRVILNTHDYLYYDGTRYDWDKYGRAQWWSPKWAEHYTLAQDMEAAGGINDGEDLWRKLVSRHPNFFLTLSGHVLATGLARLKSRARGGNDVMQILVNYQWPMYERKGSQGYLRVMQFMPDGETVFNASYSPSLGLYRVDDLNQFSFSINPPFERT